MREDLSPLGQRVVSLGGGALCTVGALIQVVALLSTFLFGMIGATLHFDWRGTTLAAVCLLVLHAFGSAMVEFGLIIMRDRLPAPPDRLIKWWSYRVLWMWLAAIMVPASITALIRAYQFQWTAIPAVAICAACFFGVRFLIAKSKQIIG